MSIARHAVDRLGSRFLHGDVEAVLAEFTESEDVVYAGSEIDEVAVGRPALRSLLVELLGRGERYSWTAGDVHEVRAGDTLLVVAEAELTVHQHGPDGWSPDERLPYRLSGVLERDPRSGPSAWRWLLCQGSEPVAPSEGTPGST